MIDCIKCFTKIKENSKGIVSFLNCFLYYNFVLLVYYNKLAGPSLLFVCIGVIWGRSLQKVTKMFHLSSLPLIPLPVNLYYPLLLDSVPRATLGCCLLRVPGQVVYIAPLISSYTPPYLFVGSCVLLLSF